MFFPIHSLVSVSVVWNNRCANYKKTTIENALFICYHVGVTSHFDQMIQH
ncbi:hypothetical protein SAMN02982927_01457 [Sporolactobacillus nakayamae]|uniref:Uncharacterized protein n=1 Tax=Sporolactobacillus nakayamae TaxID=269670 RepID=A0A1I2R635_9BACL|nr:hypothetical protein SAMN02982927_01457 [Sporolactobacillus nakayamae]